MQLRERCRSGRRRRHVSPAHGCATRSIAATCCAARTRILANRSMNHCREAQVHPSAAARAPEGAKPVGQAPHHAPSRHPCERSASTALLYNELLCTIFSKRSVRGRKRAAGGLVCRRRADKGACGKTERGSELLAISPRCHACKASGALDAASLREGPGRCAREKVQGLAAGPRLKAACAVHIK